ncbi:hypothetical protein ACFWIX_04545 [Pseudarthrobacter sp. NPDC058362]|uniref:hypothetical protein n=1 Tax=unclassified Pseudarthrobacter TaxID=2647000 RepID=UPI00364C9917
MPPCSPRIRHSPNTQYSPNTPAGRGHRYRELACIGSFLRRGLDQEPRIREAEAGRDSERGSAVVEFTFLALLLMVPIVYFIITVSQIQGGSFAVVGAADQAAKVYVAQPDEAAALAAAEQAVAIALRDFGHGTEAASVSVACTPADCQSAGSAVSVTVRLDIPLPFLPFNPGFRLGATEVEASSTQLVGRFR